MADPYYLRGSIRALAPFFTDLMLKPMQAAKPTSNIEARRNTLQSLITLLICRSTSATDLSDRLVALFDLLFAGLNDYTTDQRGDVGSWVRMASMIGLVDLLIADKAALYEAWPIMALEMAVSGLLKQSIERIDGVREVAVQQLLRLQQSGHDVARDLQSCLAAYAIGLKQLSARLSA